MHTGATSLTAPIPRRQDGDEEKINHRIPHRFQTLTNVRANWCCHCGYMLPLGRKNAKKCSGEFHDGGFLLKGSLLTSSSRDTFPQNAASLATPPALTWSRTFA